jgi:APA family basic amino acid/polyamine antiporter
MASVIRIAELASLNLFGINVAPFLNIIFMGTILGSISAMIIGGPRIYYAMAHDGLFPKAIARVHPRFGTPGNAILLQAVWSVLLVFTGRFEQLLTFSGVVLILFSAMTVASVYFIRKKIGTESRVYTGWGYPWTMLVFLAFSLWILAVTFTGRPRESLLGLAVIASGVPFYFYWKRKSNVEKSAE